MSWGPLLAIAAGAYAFKAAGMFGLGRLADGPATRTLGALLPAALLAALIVLQTFTDGQQLGLDARVAGVAVGGFAAWRGRPFWLVVILAAATTAIIRSF